MRRAYRFRAYLTRPQEGRAVRLLADHCNLYNAALEERREAWRIGVDMGVARFLTTSDGEIVANPRFLAASAAVITDLQRRTAHARPGSGNRKRLRRSLAKEWRKIRNRRRDFHHKTPRALVESCDLIALEKLNTAGMSRRPAPKPDPVHPGGYLPNGAAAKSELNKSIRDAGWAQFASILAAKAEEAGRRVILVDPACTSIDCHACGARCARPRQDTVICPAAGRTAPTSTGPGISTPGPGWALIRPERLEKLPPSGGGAVTCQSLTHDDDPDRLVGASHRTFESMESKISLRAIVMSPWISVKMFGSTDELRSNSGPAGRPRHRAR